MNISDIMSTNRLILLLIPEILRPYYSLIATNIYLAIPSGQCSGSLWLIEQCRNAFSADLKMPLNLLLLFFGEEKIIIIIVRPRRNISQRSPSTSLSQSSFSPACCHPRSGTSQGVSCQYRFPLFVSLHHERRSPRTWRSRPLSGLTCDNLIQFVLLTLLFICLPLEQKMEFNLYYLQNPLKLSGSI